MHCTTDLYSDVHANHPDGMKLHSKAGTFETSGVVHVGSVMIIMFVCVCVCV